MPLTAGCWVSRSKHSASQNPPRFAFRNQLQTSQRAGVSKWQGETKMAARKSGRKYGKSASKKVASAMRRRKRGTLRSGKGGKGGTVKSRKQAIAIGLSEARKKGAKVPRKRSS